MDIKFWKYFNCPAHRRQDNAALPRSTARGREYSFRNWGLGIGDWGSGTMKMVCDNRHNARGREYSCKSKL